MNGILSPALAPLSIQEARRIDDVCDRLESALQAGQLPRVEDYLGTIEDSLRSALLRQLLLLEWEYLQQRGGRVELGDYLARFPEHTLLIHETIKEHTLEPESTTGPFPLSAPQAAATLSEQAAAPVSLSHPAHAARWKELGYLLLSELGRGGMGTVYLACQTAADRLVALKVLHDGPHDDPAALDRFRREAMTLGRLQHAHIVPVFEVGVCDGRPFYTMEYCPGGSLAEHLRGTLLAPAEAAKLLETLARAAHAAHQAQVIHRDLKPGNVLMQTANCKSSIQEPDAHFATCNVQSAIPKLADFGLAKKLDAAP